MITQENRASASVSGAVSTAVPMSMHGQDTVMDDGALGGRADHLAHDTMEDIALAFHDVSCRFVSRTGNRAPYTAVSSTNLHIRSGEFVSIIGPTGCGKSTLLNLAAGLTQPSAGSVTVFGKSLKGLNDRTGYMFQADSLMPWSSALDNICAGLLFRGVPKEQAQAEANEWLARVGLAGHGHRYPHQMSGGMRKRVSLAQMLIMDPPILLMDEPFSALDVQTRQLMENELLELWSANRKSVMFVTHDLEEAISLSDRVILLSAGPGTHPIADFAIDLERPRDVSEIRHTPAFTRLHKAIWDELREEVLKAYAQNQKRTT